MDSTGGSDEGQDLTRQRFLNQLAEIQQDPAIRRLARVHRRSPDPGRYQMTIVTIAERLLRAIVAGDVSDADANPQLAAAYPEWFAEPRCTQNNRDQRCHRAREDLRDLLRTIVDHD